MLESPEQKRADSNAATPITLAIVPFRLLRGETKTPLGVGLADALTIRLHDVEGLSVRPTGAVLPLAEKIEDSFELGRRLGVDYILDGHILPAESRTRFSVQLLDISNQSVLWASQFDETEADIFHLEDSISARIVELLLPQLAQKANKQKKDFSITPITSSETTGEINEKDPDTNPLHDSRNDTLSLPGKAEEKKRKFNYLFIAAIAFAVLTVGATAYFLFRPANNTQTGAITLVVLPFKSENAATNSIGSGLADALTGKLGAVKAVSVLSSGAGREIAKNEGEINVSAQK
ncbi:MAG TPA: hypothetical protein VEQ34_02485, partial [Pyrinomonadaceae bacterium]|nr:hypothetical protein [Pyrinomonadaceae bacterium]